MGAPRTISTSSRTLNTPYLKLKSKTKVAALKIYRITQLPDDIDALLQPGKALYVIRRNEDLIAIGGINVEPSISDRRLGRIRRFYVHPDERR